MFAHHSRYRFAQRRRDHHSRAKDQFLQRPFKLLADPSAAGGPAGFFLRQFLSDRSVGTIASTTSVAVRKILSHLKPRHLESGLGVELGAGTGALTTEINRLMSPASRLLAFETNLGAVEILKKQFSDYNHVEVLSCSAVSLQETLAKRGVLQVRYILSGVPWSLIPEEHVSAMVRSAARLLEPGGKFIVYQTYLPRTKWENHIIKMLESEFGSGSVECSRALLNFPPLRVFVVTKRARVLSPNNFCKIADSHLMARGSRF